jgi:zinc/manganese transport system substrate-binding protein
MESSMLSGRTILLVAGAAAMFATAPAMAQSKIKVVATFSILGDLVHNVGGDRVEVTTLVGPNSDSHVYAPAPGDARKLTGAGAVFVNGLGLEGWIARLIKASGTKAPTVVTTRGVKTRKGADDHGHGHAHKATDPHAWQSVANAKIYVANIRDGLIRIDAASKDAYEANAKAYLAKLDALEAEVHAAVAKVPPDRRKVITTHDALGYFGDAYGLQFVSPEGVSTDGDASAKDIARIIGQIRKQKIPAVFLENVADPRLMQQIARETGAKVGGTLYSDALSEPGGPAGSYIEMIRNNLRELGKALAN